jgi:hypothetical protein
MVLSMHEFYSDQEMLKYIEQEIINTKSIIKKHIEKAEEKRKKYANLKGKYNEELLKGINIEQRKVGEFKILINPTVEYELYLHESIVTTLQEKLSALERAKDIVRLFYTENIKNVTMIMKDGKPIGFMIYKASTN